MPEADPEPVFHFAYYPDGSISASAPPAAMAHLGAVNWAALLQAILAAMPAIIAIINAFTGGPLPPLAVHLPRGINQNTIQIKKNG